MTTNDENADLKRRIAELEAKVAPPQSAAQREKEDREWMDQVHQARERHMSLATNFFTRDDLRAFEAAAPTAAVREDAQSLRGGVPPPSGMLPTTSQIGEVHTAPGIVGSGRGWVMPAPLGPPPGVSQADRIVDEFDRRDKAELAERLARTK
jgi:hypothetical protein